MLNLWLTNSISSDSRLQDEHAAREVGDFTRAKSLKRVIKPSVVTGQRPETHFIFLEDSAGTLHDLVHRRNANIQPNETQITSKLQQNATPRLVTRHSNGQLVVRTSDTVVFSRSCEPVVVRLSLSCCSLEEGKCSCSPILKKMYSSIWKRTLTFSPVLVIWFHFCLSHLCWAIKQQ